MSLIKKILLVLLILGAVLSIAGIYYFNNNVINSQSDLDKKSAEEQKKELLTNEEFKNLPEVVALEEQVSQMEKKDSTTTPKNANTNKSIPSQSNIENNLKEKLQSLQSEYNGRINGLVATAKKEYQQIQSGQKTESKTELAKKYVNMANGLETQCDARVYAAIAYAENQLQQYGYQSNYPEQARNVYQQTKKERRKQLLSKL